MLVLGIESTCDETGLALVSRDGVRAAVISSQVDIHALFGGVVPELASREHSRLIGPLFDLLRIESGFGLDFWKQVSAVAVSRGPGLLGSLLVGVAFAKGLALAKKLPLIGINHLHAHLLAAAMETPILFPALGLLVSGGHTNLFRMDSPEQIVSLGRTLDDAAGEACDKFAKMLGLPYPGGALLDALAKRGTADERLFPRPYTNNDTTDFSFSGLKTAGAVWLKEHPQVRFPQSEEMVRDRLKDAPQALCDVAASYLLAIADTLTTKTARALVRCKPSSLVLAGGVAANSLLRKKMSELAEGTGLPLFVPSPALCMDNAIMVAWNGLLLHELGLRHTLSLSAIPRGRTIPVDFSRA